MMDRRWSAKIALVRFGAAAGQTIRRPSGQPLAAALGPATGAAPLVSVLPGLTPDRHFSLTSCPP